VIIESGDWLVAFTDGVVEAENVLRQEYGEDRLLGMLQRGATLAPAALLNNILLDVDSFVGGAPQHDDVTCMLLRAS
jgi:sigma-B regulation protein RsbU (phosphoserine phosphatase)